MKKEKKKKKRCNHPECKKKLTLTDMACRCRKCFCANHSLTELDKCTFVFNSEYDEDFIMLVGLGG